MQNDGLEFISSEDIDVWDEEQNKMKKVRKIKFKTKHLTTFGTVDEDDTETQASSLLSASLMMLITAFAMLFFKE